MKLNPLFKRKLSPVCAFGILCSSMSGGASAMNVLVNPSFEDPATVGEYGGAGAGWTSFNGVFTQNEAQQISGSGVSAQDGVNVLKTFGTAGAFQDFTTAPGEEWLGSVWMLNLSGDQMGGGQVAAINIEWLDAGDAQISADLGGAIDASATTNTWLQRTVTGTAPTGAVKARLVLITGDFAPGGPAGAPFFDNASFELIPEPASVGLLGLTGLIAFARRRRK